jgi:putative DNA primase/helicase
VLPDESVRDYLQRLMGAALLGKVIEHVLGILTSTGFNGKSKFYEAMLYALGDYAPSAEPDLFMHRDGAHPTGEMDLMGKRLVVVSESDEGRRLAVATVKRLTGGDRIKARRMRQDFIEFDPAHLPLLVTNHLPVISGGGESIWGRIRVIPFDVFISEEDRDHHLGDKLAADADAVLVWAIDGWNNYTEHGLNEPKGVLVATDNYRVDSDAVRRFIDEMCVVSPTAYSTTGRLFAAWKPWAASEGLPEIGSGVFGKALDSHGYPQGERNRAGRFRFGLGLKSEEDEP